MTTIIFVVLYALLGLATCALYLSDDIRELENVYPAGWTGLPFPQARTALLMLTMWPFIIWMEVNEL